jgi:hypothetical protein
MITDSTGLNVISRISPSSMHETEEEPAEPTHCNIEKRPMPISDEYSRKDQAIDTCMMIL